MEKRTTKKTLNQLKKAFEYEEKNLIDFLYECYKDLPGNFNEKELQQVRTILDLLIIQSLKHANILTDLIIKYYGESSKKV